jgi:hypothetical protein
MYVVPKDLPDESFDRNGALALSVNAMQQWLGKATGGRRLRVDTYRGEPEITFFRLSRTNQEMMSYREFVRDQIELEIGHAGFGQPDKLYAVYYGGGSTWSCGGGAWPPALPGRVAAIYLYGTPPGARPCGTNEFAASSEDPGYREFSMLHEIFHSLGVVATCAPNHTLAGHVSDDPTDVMYAGPLAWEPEALDVGGDDYFEHGNGGCLDLADSPYLTP